MSNRPRSHRPVRTSLSAFLAAGLAASSTLIGSPIALATQTPAGTSQPSTQELARTRAAPALQDSTVQAKLDSRLVEERAVGLVVSIIEPDGRARFFSAGPTSKGGTRVDADTIFEIGSITKAFTGVLLAQAVERGDMKLSDTVRMHAPVGLNFPPGTAGDITLLQLATHTSGLPRLPMNWTFIKAMLSDPTNPYKHYAAAAMWQYLTGYKHDASKPHVPEYSNLGFGLLGALLANRAGLSYFELVKRDILLPLGMHDTFQDVPAALTDRFAVGHDDKLSPTSYWDLPAMPGAGALRSSARDMAKWIAAMQGGSLAGARLSGQVHGQSSERRSSGLGWAVTASRGDEIVWHNGGTGGFRSFAGFSRMSGRGVVVLGNASASVDDLGFHLINDAFELQAKERRSTGAGWFAVLITLLVWLSGLMTPWRTRFVAAATDLPSPTEPSTTISKQKWFPARIIATRIDAAWAALDVLLIAALLHMFGPWGSLGQSMRWVVVGTLLVSAAFTTYRARVLPWSIAQRAPWRIKIVRGLSLLLLLGVVMFAVA